MSKEIKFRGYVEKIDDIGIDVPHEGHFLYGDLVHGNNFDYIVGGLIEATEEYAALEWWQTIQQGAAEQYTGLKDANGKEIYEGDILAWHSSICRKHNWVGLVLYRGAGFVVQESSRSFSTPDWLETACNKDANIIEVVGNIHENPELLEADE